MACVWQLEAQQGESPHLSAEREAISASFADMRSLLQRSKAERRALQDRLRQLQTAPATADTTLPIQARATVPRMPASPGTMSTCRSVRA